MPPTDSSPSNLYADRLLEAAPQVLSHLDREPFSSAFGSFDRLHWAWGASDFSNMDLQRLILPLSFLYQYQAPRNPYFHNGSLLRWIEQAFSFCLLEQYTNGAFTQCYPNDNSVVTAGLLVHDAHLAAELLKGNLGAKTQEQFRKMCGRAGRFLLRHEERHGFNSNHQLGMAAGLLDLNALTGESGYRQRALFLIEKVLQRQLASGAFFEYLGADPGYQTLGVAHLAACSARLEDPRLRKALARALEFSSHFLSPVSGNGGCYGCRGTKLLFPSGFELAARFEAGPDLRAAVRAVIQRDLGITNRTTDLQNLVPLLSDYVRAFLAAGGQTQESPGPARHAHASDFFCPASTLFCLQRGRGTARGRLNGGMVQVEDEEANRVLFSSAGYFIRLGRSAGFTGVMDGRTQRQGDRMTFRACAQRPTRLRQRPLFFLLLRVYQLAFGWFMPANLALKRLMAKRLIFRSSKLPFRMERTIHWTASELVIDDHLENLSREPALVRHCRQGYLHFMGSARYFDLSELNAQADLEADWELLPGAQRKIRYRVPMGGGQS
ncbi:MAG: hypothetical protein HYS41_01540 [Candidatus Omnitrophica bacterium]|nr:hypothetical protein [Candidatus Omnitrophota bacterium]